MAAVVHKSIDQALASEKEGQQMRMCSVDLLYDADQVFMTDLLNIDDRFIYYLIAVASSK